MSVNLIPLLLVFIFPWLVSSTEQASTRGHECIKLTEKSIASFTRHLRSCLTDPLVLWAQSQLIQDSIFRSPYLKYMIGSVVIFGSVDECALGIICELCQKRMGPLLDFVNELTKKNDFDTAARFAAENIARRHFAPLRNFIIKMAEEDWSVMEGFIARILAILRGKASGSGAYRFMIRHLSAERQYAMIAAGEVSLDVMACVYRVGKDDPLLREIFFLARCSRNPSPEIRKRIADKFSHFQQFLPDGAIPSTAALCSERAPELNNDAWYNVSRFLDTETLILVFPLVCKSWRNLHPTILGNSTKIHDLYLLDLKNTRLDSIHTIAPWKYCLCNEENALSYLGRCIADGVLDRVKLEGLLSANVVEYMDLVTYGITPLPRARGCATPYDAFLWLFERVHELCTVYRPVLGKPAFLSDEEYERAVYRFVYEQRQILELSGSLVAGDMPKLFSIIMEDEKLMEELARHNFYNFVGASAILILYGQTRQIPEKLARLLFSRTHLFKGLLEPVLIPSDGYYNFIAESDIIAEVIAEGFKAPRFPQFLISFILFFKNRPDEIDRIVASINGRFASHHNPELNDIKCWLSLAYLKSQMVPRECPADDFEFFEKAMTKCGLM